MSIDFYVAVPAVNWPTTELVQRCMVERTYPIHVTRFPSPVSNQVVTEGALVTVDGGTEAHLEGELFLSALDSQDVDAIPARLSSTPGRYRFSSSDVMMSVRVRSPVEMRAASYVIAGLIICFDGYGFEPQGNEHGREAFAESLINRASALKGL